MDQHAVPRQITTFEFKLIGFLTLKQFLYVVIFLLSAVVIYFLIPIPIVNFVCAGIVGIIGIAFAFVPVNERPLDVWVRNFVRKLYTPTQFYYHKKNQPPDFLKDVHIGSSPTIISTHIDARKKLAACMSRKNISTTNTSHVIGLKIADPKTESQSIIESVPKKTPNNITPPEQLKNNTDQKQPFLVSYVKNNKNIPLPNILIYIKTEEGKTERMLKTNTHGVFATFHLLTEGEYIFECKDTSGKYFFDTINIPIHKDNPDPLIIKSKETL